MNFNIFNRKEKRNKQLIQDTFNYVAQALQFGTVYQDHPSRTLSAVYRAVELISDSIAILPIKVRNKLANHTEDIPGHPIHFALNNNLIAQYNLIKMMLENVMLRGNGYAFIIRGQNRQPIGLRYLNPSEVTINYNKQKQTLNYKVSDIPGRIEPEDMIHFKKNTNDGITGISVISYANRTLGLSHATEDQAKSFFERGCNLAGILTVNSALNDKQRKDIFNAWNQVYTDGGSGLAVLSGDMTYSPVTVNAADAQLLESRKYNIQDIARFFGISPVLLGDTTTTYSSIEALQNDFLLHTLLPYIEMVEQEFNRKLNTDEDLIIKLDETYLLRTDKAAQASYYQTMLSTAVLCINEVRAEMGLAPIDGGDKHLIPYTNISQNTINEQGNSTVQPND